MMEDRETRKEALFNVLPAGDERTIAEIAFALNFGMTTTRRLVRSLLGRGLKRRPDVMTNPVTWLYSRTSSEGPKGN